MDSKKFYAVNWNQLQHAYGTASDIPELLDRLLESDEDSTLERLWNSLCHQKTIYSASIAAFPFLIQFFRESERVAFLDLAGAILMAVLQGQMPKVSAELESNFSEATTSVRAIFTTALDLKNDLGALKYLGIITALSGHKKLGLQLFDSTLEIECPSCESTFPRFYDSDDNFSFEPQNGD